jgi:hypothetical protein
VTIRATESCNKYTFYPKFKTDFKDRFYNFVSYYKSSQRWIVIKNPLARLPPHLYLSRRLHLPPRLHLRPRFPINILFVTKLHTKKLKQVLFLYYLLLFYFIYVYLFLQKEVFIWTDSELKDLYEIDDKLTWVEQKEEIITKLLPPLYKLVNKKYNVTNSELLKMLYGRWRSRHRVYNIKLQGKEQMRKHRRRVNKNSKMQAVSKYSINMK